MKREAYRLANEFQTDFSADQDQLMDSPDDMEMKRYEANALREIRKEKKAAKGSIGKITAAACIAAALLARKSMHPSGKSPGASAVRWDFQKIWQPIGMY